MVGYTASSLFKHEDTSLVKKESRHGAQKAKTDQSKDIITGKQTTTDKPTSARGISQVAANAYAEDSVQTENRKSIHTLSQPVKYKAPQVIERPGGDPERTLPIGTSFIGKLITGIDTREPNQLARAALPYGGSFDHDRKIDKGSIIFGRVSYPGDGEKAYIQFNRLLFPDGREFKIQAEALSSRDYTPGLLGSEHDGAEDRIVGTTGLTLLSGITDALTEKEEVGVLGATTPKSTIHNAFMNGITKSTEAEAQREGAKMTNAKDFVTIPAGTDVIISLIETFHGEQQR